MSGRGSDQEYASDPGSDTEEGKARSEQELLPEKDTAGASVTAAVPAVQDAGQGEQEAGRSPRGGGGVVEEGAVIPAEEPARQGEEDPAAKAGGQRQGGAEEEASEPGAQEGEEESNPGGEKVGSIHDLGSEGDAPENPTE